MFQTYVKGMQSKKRAAKSKFYDVGIELNFPDLKGVLSSAQIGAMFAAELVDFIRMNWEHGKQALGQPAAIHKGGETLRSIHKNVLDNTKLDTTLSKKEQFKKEVVKNYILIRRTNYNIVGIRSKTVNKAKYVPDLGAKPLMSSGLMHDSLAGAYVPQRVRTVHGTSVVSTAWIRLRVANNRNTAAYKWAGLKPEDSQRFVAALESNPGSFQYTTALINNALAWVPPKQSWFSIAEVARAVSQVMRFLTRV